MHLVCPLFAGTTDFACVPTNENEVEVWRAWWPVLYTTMANPLTTEVTIKHTFYFTAKMARHSTVFEHSTP
jgi:hypothetical protein